MAVGPSARDGGNIGGQRVKRPGYGGGISVPGGGQGVTRPGVGVTSVPGATGTPGGAAPGLDLRADTNQALEALSSRYTKHLDNMEGQDGRMMDLAGSRIRDAREGGRRALQEDSLQAGRASDPALSNYDASTTGAVAGAVADVAQQREANMTGALMGGVGVHSAAPDLALREKGLQVGAYQAENAAKAQANNMAFQQFLALLNANRSSPIYSG